MDKNDEHADVILICGDNEVGCWMTEKAERRIGWVMTGIMILAVSPAFALPFLI